MSYQRYKGIKGKAWTMFSKYIRARDQGVCITCGRPAKGSGYHAGHFIPMGVAGSDNKLGWDEGNVYGQCMSCNIWKGGWGEKFTEVLEKRFGRKFVKDLRDRRHKYDPMIDYKKFSSWEEVVVYYKDKIKKLK